jgi:hypothetical protein
MLLVSEHGTGFGLLPLMLVLMGLPAFGALTLAGHIGRARCGVGSIPAADLAVQSAGGVKRRNPAWLEMPAPDASGTRPHALTQKKEVHHAFYLVHRTRRAAAGFRTGRQGQWSYQPVACAGRRCAG